LPAGAPQKFASNPIYLYLENTTKWKKAFSSHLDFGF
jgi:hypothetical protein